MSITTNGQTIPVLDEFPVFDNDDVPLSKAAFLEDMWSNIGDQVNESYSDENGSFTITVSNYLPTYQSSGSGEVGTTITAGMNFAYTIVGNLNGQAVNQSVNYNWTLTYKRIN